MTEQLTQSGRPATYEQMIAKAKELEAAGQVEDARKLARMAIERRNAAQASPIRVEVPGGNVVEFPAGTPPETIERALGQHAASPGQVDLSGYSDTELDALEAKLSGQTAPQATDLGQTGTGLNKGLAALAGAPVEAMTAGLNLGSAALNKYAGTDLPQITDPVGGFDTFDAILNPFNEQAEPQTARQRYLRSIGQEVGAMAVPALGMAGKLSRPIAAGGAELASAVTSGVSGQVAEDLGAGPNMRAVAEIAGGLTPFAAAKAIQPTPRAPSIDEIRHQRNAAYSQRDSTPVALTPEARDRMVAETQAYLDSRSAHPELNRRAVAAQQRMATNLPERPTLADIDAERKLWGRDVAGAPEMADRELGSGVKRELDAFIASLQPRDISGNSADIETALSAQAQGRSLHQRLSKAQMLEGEDIGIFDRAKRGAAVSGTGGNEINSTRRRIAALLANPKQRRGYSEAELTKMRRIADGTRTDNALRWVGRSLSPTTGGLSGMATVAQVAGGMATGNPLWAAPMAAGIAATKYGERRMGKAVQDLGEMVRNGGKPVAKPETSEAMKAVIRALAAGQAGQLTAQ